MIATLGKPLPTVPFEDRAVNLDTVPIKWFSGLLITVNRGRTKLSICYYERNTQKMGILLPYRPIFDREISPLSR